MSADPGPPAKDEPDLTRSLRRWQWAGAVIGLGLLAAFPLYLGVEETRRDEALTLRERALVTLGRDLWSQSCASCHGEDGEGVDAPALNAAQFFDGTSHHQIHHITASGVPGTEMPAWWNELGGPLTDEQIEAVVAFMLTWERDAPDRPDWRTPGGAHAEEAGGGGGAHEEGEAAGPMEVVLSISDAGCEPLDLDVPAGERFVLVLNNGGSSGVSFDASSLDQHLHVEAGDRIEIPMRLDAGEYPFECLGSAHGTVLGAGQVHAE